MQIEYETKQGTEVKKMQRMDFTMEEFSYLVHIVKLRSDIEIRVSVIMA